MVVEQPNCSIGWLGASRIQNGHPARPRGQERHLCQSILTQRRSKDQAPPLPVQNKTPLVGADTGPAGTHNGRGLADAEGVGARSVSSDGRTDGEQFFSIG
jgi:hypothetical protein